MSEWKGKAEAYSREKVTVCHCGGTGYVRLDVPVGHELFGKPIPCACLRDDRARERARELRQRSGISDEELGWWTFETFHAARCQPLGRRDASQTGRMMSAIKEQCEMYARDPRGWLILCGVPGSGKTHLAYAIAALQLSAGHAVYASTVSELMTTLRSSYSVGAFDAWFGTVRDVAVLVLDDFGAQRDTEWVMDTLFQLVNHRYARRLPLVVTTNVPPGSKDSGIEPRIASRMMDGTRSTEGWSKVLTLPCGDFRPTRRVG